MPFLERSKSARAKCAVCKKPIEDAIRVVEDIDREDESFKSYSHLACTIEMRRELAHDALTSRETTGPIVAEVLDEVSRLDPKLANEVRALRDRRVRAIKKETPLDDPRTQELLAELEASPRDRGLYAVLADHLQLIGDDRGELIALDLTGSTDEAALVRRRELTAAHAPNLNMLDRAHWGYGFIRKLEMHHSQVAMVAHPSCRLLESLTIGTVDASQLPRSLRRLRVQGTLSGDLSRLPYLEHLEVTQRGDFVAGPALRSIVFERSVDAMRGERSLPGVTRVHVSRMAGQDRIVDTLAPLLAQVTELELSLMTLTLDDLRGLEFHFGSPAGRAGRKLAKLIVCSVGWTTNDRPRLAALCETLDFTGPAAPRDEVRFVEHDKLGRGRVVREFDDNIEIEFASGRRIIKRRFVRPVE